MAVAIISSPAKIVNGNTSNVNAGRSQLPYSFQRQDTTISWVSSNGTNITINTSANFVDNQFAIGDRVFCWTANEAGMPNGVYEVLNVIDNAGLVQLVIDYASAYGGNADTGYVNNLTVENYKIQVRVMNDLANDILIDTVFKYSPKPDGNLFMDAGEIITEYQEETAQISLMCRLDYTESYDGFQGVFVSSPIIQSVYATKQINLDGGSNMVEYLLRKHDYSGGATWALYDVDKLRLANIDAHPFINGNKITVQGTEGTSSGNYLPVPTPTVISNVGISGLDTQIPFDGSPTSGGAHLDLVTTPRLLHKTTNCFMWRGWKRTVSVLMDDNYQARTGDANPRMYIYENDINKDAVVPPTSTTVGVSIAPQITGVEIPQPSHADTKYMRCRMQDSGGVYSDQYYFQLFDECAQPIMVEFLNQVGAFEQHLFNINQSFERNVEQGLTAERAITKDQETVNRTKLRLPLRWTQSLIISADNLLQDQLQALMEIKQSAVVRVWNNKEGSKYIHVVVTNQFNSQFNSEDTAHEFSCQLTFPDNYDFFTAKEY